jgi:hypothetical protein
VLLSTEVLLKLLVYQFKYGVIVDTEFVCIPCLLVTNMRYFSKLYKSFLF